MLGLFFNLQNKKNKVAVFLLFIFFSGMLHAKTCPSRYYFPNPQAILHMDSIELDIEINFLNKNKAGQRVFLIEKDQHTIFSPENPIQTVYLEPGFQRLVYCVNESYVNEQDLKIVADSSILCSANEKLECKANNSQ